MEKIIEPASFIRSIINHTNLNIFEQQDVHETLITLLNKL